MYTWAASSACQDLLSLQFLHAIYPVADSWRSHGNYSRLRTNSWLHVAAEIAAEISLTSLGHILLQFQTDLKLLPALGIASPSLHPQSNSVPNVIVIQSQRQVSYAIHHFRLYSPHISQHKQRLYKNPSLCKSSLVYLAHDVRMPMVNHQPTWFGH